MDVGEIEKVLIINLVTVHRVETSSLSEHLVLFE